MHSRLYLFSWDNSREQVISSHISGSISFIINPGKPESSEEFCVDFRIHSLTFKSPGAETREYECHAQAFHKHVNGDDTLWRIESFGQCPNGL